VKTASAPLEALLETGGPFNIVELYTFTLLGGITLRWCAGDVPVTLGGNSYNLGPPIDRTQIQNKRGAAASTMGVTIYPRTTDLVNGQDLAAFILGGGLDNGYVQLLRAFAKAPSTAWVGALTMFYGRVGEIADAGSTAISFSVSDPRELLSTYSPSDVFQASCLNTLYDAKCTLSKAANTFTGAVIAGTRTQTAFPTNLALAANLTALGTITFTSGLNTGVTCTVRSQDASGNLVLASPLPSAPAVGDAFSIAKGCDRLRTTCSSKFSNLINYRGQDFVPVPETAV
jgi:uncharacterized phage protein (TIGR02218 family)